MCKAIRVRLHQTVANYRKSSSFMVKESYPLPPYSTVIGMIQTACGFKEYHPMKLSIQGTNASEFFDYQTLYTFGPTPFDASRHQIQIPMGDNKPVGVTRGPRPIMLLSDIDLVIHIFPENKEDFDVILNGLRNPVFYPCLGRREDTVRIDDVSVVELSKTDSDDDELITTAYPAYLPLDYLSDSIRKKLSGTVYNLSKCFDIENDFRRWSVMVKAVHIPSNFGLFDEVLDLENVFYDSELQTPVFFA